MSEPTNGKGMKPEESVDWEKIRNSKLWDEDEPMVDDKEIYIVVQKPCEYITVDLEITNGVG